MRVSLAAVRVSLTAVRVSCEGEPHSCEGEPHSCEGEPHSCDAAVRLSVTASSQQPHSLTTNLTASKGNSNRRKDLRDEHYDFDKLSKVVILNCGFHHFLNLTNSRKL